MILVHLKVPYSIVSKSVPLSIGVLIRSKQKIRHNFHILSYLLFCTFLYFKQECIPVGCIPPTCYHTGGSLWQRPPGQRPLERGPPGQRPSGQRLPGQRPPWIETCDKDHLDRDPRRETSQTETPLDRDPPLTETPLGHRPPQTETSRMETPLDRDRDPPCGQTDNCENIIFANFVCGR